MLNDFALQNQYAAPQLRNAEGFIDHSHQSAYGLAMLCKKTMRENILKAAMERFLHYGYPKTTMAEIACATDDRKASWTPRFTWLSLASR